MNCDDLDLYSAKVREFLAKIRKQSISEEKKKIFYLIVEELENRTALQKERFLLYYRLMPNNDEKLTLWDIAKKYNCTSNAIRYSIIKITAVIARIKDKEKREQILEIIEDKE